MRVDDDVGHHAVLGEWHVLLRQGEPAHALLAHARRELVADDGRARLAHAHLHRVGAIAVGHVEHRVDDALLVPHDGGLVALDGAPRALSQLGGAHRLRHEHIVDLHARAHGHDARVVQVVVVGVALAGHARELSHVLEALRVGAAVLVLLVAVGLQLDAAEHAAVEGGLVHDDGVLLVLSGVALDGHDGVDPRGRLRYAHHGVHARRHQRALRGDHGVRDGVHADRMVERVHPQRLLHHGRLVGVARALVVVGKGDARAAESHDERRVELAVRVRAPALGGLAQRPEGHA